MICLLTTQACLSAWTAAEDSSAGGQQRPMAWINTFTHLHGHHDQNQVRFGFWKDCIHLWWHSDQSTVSDHRYNTHCLKSQLKGKQGVALMVATATSHVHAIWTPSESPSLGSSNPHIFQTSVPPGRFSLLKEADPLVGILDSFRLTAPEQYVSVEPTALFVLLISACLWGFKDYYRKALHTPNQTISCRAAILQTVLLW